MSMGLERLNWPWRRAPTPGGEALTVEVGTHALDRARQRVDEGYSAARIIGEVCLAWQDGRWGRHVDHPDVYHSAYGFAKKMAWTPDGKIAYVVRQHRKRWYVVTAIVPKSREISEHRLQALARRFS